MKIMHIALGIFCIAIISHGVYAGGELTFSPEGSEAVQDMIESCQWLEMLNTNPPAYNGMLWREQVVSGLESYAGNLTEVDIIKANRAIKSAELFMGDRPEKHGDIVAKIEQVRKNINNALQKF